MQPKCAIQYIYSLTNYFKELQADDRSLEYQLNLEKVKLTIDTVLPLGIICAELLSNSFKYARQGDRKLRISMKLRGAGDKYVFSYKDNGLGYGCMDNRDSNTIGLYLMQSMVKQLQAFHKFFDNSGACFEIEFSEKIVSLV